MKSERWKITKYAVYFARLFLLFSFAEPPVNSNFTQVVDAVIVVTHPL